MTRSQKPTKSIYTVGDAVAEWGATASVYHVRAKRLGIGTRLNGRGTMIFTASEFARLKPGKPGPPIRQK